MSSWEEGYSAWSDRQSDWSRLAKRVARLEVELKEAKDMMVNREVVDKVEEAGPWCGGKEPSGGEPVSGAVSAASRISPEDLK
jgi:hypothetical protein